MKKAIYMALAALTLCLSACDIAEFGEKGGVSNGTATTNEETRLAPESAFVAPELVAIGDIDVNQTNTDETVSFAWSDASFGAPVSILYSLYLSAGDQSAVAGTAFTNSLSMTKADLNGILINALGVKANDLAAVTAYVTATVADTDINPVRSNTRNFNVQTFKAKLNSLYICGQFENGWDVDHAPEFWETGGGTKIYKVLIDYLAGGTIVPGEDQGFKILTQRAWAGDYWGYSGLTPSWECPENGDENFQFGASAKEIYHLTVDLNKKEISAVGIDAISLIGNFAESNWEADVDFTYDYLENVWTAGPVTFSGGNGFLIRYNHAWDTKLGTATKASDDVEGGFELEEGGADMNVPGDGTYLMKLYGNRTPFVLVMEKQ
ncbi:MAG: SusE domain-containing protein [Bacteroidales bacterium]|nr:SusE domain-containing protein [Bacteroidales bacterium]